MQKCQKERCAEEGTVKCVVGNRFEYYCQKHRKGAYEKEMRKEGIQELLREF